MRTFPVTGTVASKSGVVCLARVLGNLGVPISTATISAITWTLTDSSGWVGQPWRAGTEYGQGDQVIGRTGTGAYHLFSCTAAGTSGAAEPAWNLGGTTTDNGVAWLDLGPTSAAAGSLTVASVVFNTLVQNDPRWDIDSQYSPGADNQWGYNFLFTLPASALAKPDKYQLDVRFVPVSGEPFTVPFALTALQVYGP